MNKIVMVVLCDVLGYSKECFVLKEINSLNSIIESDPKYEEIVSEHDELCCIIANDIKESFELSHDKDKWTQFYKVFLSQIAVLVATNQYEQAIIKYQHMILVLKDYFNIDNININNKKIMIKKDNRFYF